MIAFEPDITIFDCGCEALVNPVNCIGVMGAGLALEVSRRYPAVMTPYRRACAQHTLRPGYIQFLDLPTDDISIINVATKDHWRAPSRLEWVDAGLRNLASLLESGVVASVAVPQIGTGKGGLFWTDVAPLVAHHLAEVAANGVDVVVTGPRVYAMSN